MLQSPSSPSLPLRSYEELSLNLEDIEIFTQSSWKEIAQNASNLKIPEIFATVVEIQGCNQLSHKKIYSPLAFQAYEQNHEGSTFLDPQTQSPIIRTYSVAIPVFEIENALLPGAPYPEKMPAFPLDSVQNELEECCFAVADTSNPLIKIETRIKAAAILRQAYFKRGRNNPSKASQMANIRKSHNWHLFIKKHQ